MKKLVYILFFVSSLLGNAQNSALFDQAKQQYKAEKYQEAISNWTKILEQGQHSAAVYFNIANAHYELNNIGPSIYFYEKALQLDPNDSDIKNNLAFARNATVDAIEPLPQTVFAKWDDSLSSWLTYNGWAWVAVASMIAFAVLFLMYYFSVRTSKKRILFIGSLLSITVLVTALTMSFRNYNKQQNDMPAIIFAESTAVKSEPKLNSDTSFLLHEGTKVQIIAEESEWSRILLVDGKDGWIPSDDLQKI